MTRASLHDVKRPGAILARLLVVLTLALFGLPKAPVGGAATLPGPAAESTVEQPLGIPSAQPHLQRAHLPNDTSPDAVLPGIGAQSSPYRTAATLSPVPPHDVTSIAIRILPPLRGPPAV